MGDALKYASTERDKKKIGFLPSMLTCIQRNHVAFEVIFKEGFWLLKALEVLKQSYICSSVTTNF